MPHKCSIHIFSSYLTEKSLSQLEKPNSLMLYLVQESCKTHKYTEWQNTEFLNVTTSGTQI